MKIRSIIVDDESANRGLIKKLIGELHPNFNVVGEASNIDEAFELIKKEQPGLVFLDIKMPGGTGFELLERFHSINFEVVFITGFDSYALKAFEFSALDYILKPINPVKFAKALTKIYDRVYANQNGKDGFKRALETFDHKKNIISRLAVHSGSKVIFLNIQDIVFVQSEQRCVNFKTADGINYTSAKDLADFSFILEKYDFMMRISKSVYVNLNYVTGYTKGEPCFLLLKNDLTVEVPRRKKSEILSLIFKTE